MQKKFAISPKCQVERLTHTTLKVKRGSEKAYFLFAPKGSTELPHCDCSWGMRNGTCCTHARDAQEFLLSEAAQLKATSPVTQVVSTAAERLSAWIKQQEDNGDILFAR